MADAQLGPLAEFVRPADSEAPERLSQDAEMVDAAIFYIQMHIGWHLDAKTTQLILIRGPEPQAQAQGQVCTYLGAVLHWMVGYCGGQSCSIKRRGHYT